MLLLRFSGPYVVFARLIQIFDLKKAVCAAWLVKTEGFKSIGHWLVQILAGFEKHRTQRFVYTNGMTYRVPFVPLEEVNCPTGPRSDSPRSKLKKPLQQLVERYYNYYVNIKKSKYFRNLIEFLNYEPFSSKQ